MMMGMRTMLVMEAVIATVVLKKAPDNGMFVLVKKEAGEEREWENHGKLFIRNDMEWNEEEV